MAGSFPAAGERQLSFGMVVNAAALARPAAVLKLVPEIMASMETFNMASMEATNMALMESTRLCGSVR